MENKKALSLIKDIFPLTKYDHSKSRDDCVTFTGSPVIHPYDENKFLLIADPLSDHTNFLEFHKTDVIYIEELTSILSPGGETVPMIRSWIKTGVIGVRYEPFIVGKTKKAVDEIKKKK